MAGRPAPLSLAPVHLAGERGREGGGLLYHRPGLRAPGDERFDPSRPRRFEPAALPRGLTQVAGHTGHEKLLRELAPHADASAKARPRGGLRTLLAGETVRYLGGIHAPGAGEAALHLVDAELGAMPVEEIPLLPLADLAP